MKSYSITNIKSFKNHTEVNLKPITIFVGKNSCGKSSLMRFPVVLAQTSNSDASSPLKFYGKLIDYGYYDDVTFSNSNDPIEFSIKYTIDTSYTRFQRSLKEKESKSAPKDVEVIVSLNKSRKKVIIEKNELLVDGVLSYGLYRESSGIYKTKIYQTYDYDRGEFVNAEMGISIKNCTQHQFFVVIDEHDISEAIKKEYFSKGFSEYENGIKTTEGNVYPLEVIMSMPRSMRERFWKQYGASIPENDRIHEYMAIFSCFSYYSELLGIVHECFDEESDIVSYIGPFRKNPERIYRDEEFQTRQVGAQGENVSTVLIRDYQKKKELITSISSWLQNTMGYNLVVDEISNGLFRLLLEDENGIRSNIMDVGYGISQILPIVAQLLVDVPKRKFGWGTVIDSLVIVEQPELHLHPAAQSELADLFVRGAVDGKKKLLIETHSEHLIRKLQVLIADPCCGITNEDVVIYYVDKDANGIASIRELRILPNGKFAEKWPSGFFDKAHELSMELLNASKTQG